MSKTPMSDSDFVWKLTNEGVNYALLHYFAQDTLKDRQDPELREAVLEAQQALVKLDKLLQDKYEKDIA